MLAGAAIGAVAFGGDGLSESDCAVTEASTLERAVELAVGCGHDVAAVSTYDPWSRQVATPARTLRYEASTGAVRTDVSGDWEPTDPTVVRDSSGVLAVASPVYAVQLAGAAGDGEGFLALSSGGGRVSFDAPTALGDPVVTGSQVTWPMLDAAGAPLEGVTLAVHVADDAAGATPVIDVRDPDAYAALVTAAGDAGVSFTVRSSPELKLTRPQAASGGFAVVVAATGEHVLRGGVPMQWDSSSPAAAEGRGIAAHEPETAVPAPEAGPSAPEPADGDVVAVLDVTSVDAQTLVITADEQMAADPGTQWPIAIDPEVDATRNEWTAIRSISSWGSKYKSSATSGEGVGRCADATECQLVHSARLLWEYTGMSLLNDVVAGDVVDAKFSATITHSADCTSQPLDLHLMNQGISEATVWSNQPSSRMLLATQKPKYRVDQCGEAGWVDWDVTAGAKALAGSATTMTLELRSPTEDSMSTWRRFRMNDAKLTIEVNQAPDRPDRALMQFDHDGTVTKCNEDGSTVWIPSRTPQLGFKATDPDSRVKASFEVYQDDELVWEYATSTTFPSGSLLEKTVPSGELVSGVQARWRARVTDAQGRNGPWSLSCWFVPDNVAPVTPKIVPVEPSGPDSGIKAVYERGEERGGAGVRGCFSIDRTTSTDVTKVRFEFAPSSSATKLSGSKVVTEPVNEKGRAYACLSPSSSGPMSLTAASVDKAGNVSSVFALYTFDVATAIEDGIWTFDSGASPARDVSVVDSGEPTQPGDMLVTGGVGWVGGPHTLFDAREGDLALSFSGDGGEARLRSRVLDTSMSFVISAHVKLTDTAESRTALAQESTWSSRTNAWQVGYQKDCLTGTAGCWVFGLYAEDGTVLSRVYSTVPPVKDNWTNLVAEYDKPEGRMRLWVCDIGTPSDPGLGEPVVAAGVAPSMWRTDGALVLGRDQKKDKAVERWQGAIDNVRVFEGEVVAPAKIRRICQGAEANAAAGSGANQANGGFGALDDLDPTKAGQ